MKVDKKYIKQVLEKLIAKNGVYWDGGNGECIVCGAHFSSGKIKHYPSCGIVEAKKLLKQL